VSEEDTRPLRFLVRCWEELERRRGERRLTTIEETAIGWVPWCPVCGSS
jgi:hypothetical protein